MNTLMASIRTALHSSPLGGRLGGVPLLASRGAAPHVWQAARAHSGRPCRPLGRCHYCAAALTLAAGGEGGGGRMRYALICGACRRIQPFPMAFLTFFDLLNGGVVSFDLCQAAIRTAFYALQRQLHPDNFGGDEDECRKASAWSQFINGAYETLRTPLLRAIYMHNLVADEKYLAAAEGRTGGGAAGQLAAVLEAREALEEATECGVAQRIHASALTAIDDEQARIGAAFAREDLQAVRASIDHLRYLVALAEASEERVEALSGGAA